MDKQRMKEILFELKDELASNDQIDEAQTQSMTALAQEIESKLKDPEMALTGYQYLLTRLKDETEEFETNHPKLTEIVGRLSDLLARMGI